MKRPLFVWALFAGIALPAVAGKPLITRMVTVEQLRQVLAANHDLPDAKLAKLIVDMKLTERLSDAAFASLRDELPGPKAKLALLALGDESAFLDLPAAEIPSTPAPDRAAQIAMVNRAMDYMLKTIPKLPDFFATRETSRFLGTSLVVPQPQRDFYVPQAMYSTYQRLTYIKNTTGTVRYREGLELFVDRKHGGKADCEPGDITGDGEFGEFFARVAYEATHGKVVWSHWEQGSEGLLAVFRYEAVLTYTYQSHCQNEPRHAPVLVRFHGEISMNPADGSILSLTEMGGGGDIVDYQEKPVLYETYRKVNYGPIQLGGMTYLCPVRSIYLALTLLRPESDGTQTSNLSDDALPEALNDRTFSQYHLFRAESHIIGSADPVPDRTPSAPASESPQVKAPTKPTQH